MLSSSFLLRAEPVLTRIKENRKRIISPSFDNIKYDNFEIEEYPLAAQGFDWELWCRYLNPPKAWWKLENSTAPIRCGTLPCWSLFLGPQTRASLPAQARCGWQREGKVDRGHREIFRLCSQALGSFEKNQGSDQNLKVSKAQTFKNRFIL